MVSKRFIHAKQNFNPAVGCSLTMPEDPMIYSVKDNIAGRLDGMNYFRNKKWRAIFKCIFKTFNTVNTPLVLLIRFYVPPQPTVKVEKSILRAEKTPAPRSHELADYLLSFMEMLHKCLIGSYAQICKVEMDKFYSDKPRTVFKIMSWDDYEQLQSYYSVHAEGKSVSATWPGEVVQQELSEHDAHAWVRGEGHASKRSKSIRGPIIGGGALPITDSIKPGRTKAKKAASISSRTKARRRQPREVLE